MTYNIRFKPLISSTLGVCGPDLLLRTKVVQARSTVITHRNVNTYLFKLVSTDTVLYNFPL